MGHERLGLLPKTRSWRDIVHAVTSSTDDPRLVGEITKNVIANVQDRFLRLAQDEATTRAFKFLIFLSIAARRNDPQDYLADVGIQTTDDPTPLELAGAAFNWIGKTSDPEHNNLAASALIDTIGEWYRSNAEIQHDLFKSRNNFAATWERSGNARGFCELARQFFSNYTKRYLKYFLDREATAALPDLKSRENFERNLSAHVEDISKHAFETARVTQSFAAGWFNNFARDRTPSEQEVSYFLSRAFGKLASELTTEAEGQRDGP